jgi:hypothetical protein
MNRKKERVKLKLIETLQNVKKKRNIEDGGKSADHTWSSKCHLDKGICKVK